MPAPAAPAQEIRLSGRATGGVPELASFRAAFPGRHAAVPARRDPPVFLDQRALFPKCHNEKKEKSK